jgi:hypothetical protein
VGETLAETRVEVGEQRAALQRTGEQLEARVRHAVDIPARFRENPALFVGLGLGTAFLVVGGPGRVARALRRHLRPKAAEQAYDALPKAMQAWVDTVAGPGARARNALVEELQGWRRDQLKSRKARRELAKAMVDGPPGPSRAMWKAAEAALTLVSAAVARRAIERFVTGGRAPEPPARKAAAPAAPADSPGQREYSGFSTLGRSGDANSRSEKTARP